MPYLLALLTLTQPPAPTETPLQRVAARALAGEFGNLRPWQRAAYERALSRGGTRHRAWVTHYGPYEGYDRGEGCAYGYGCSEEIAAATALPAKTVVWIENPAHLRVIGDTGSRNNDRVARRRGAEWWLDLWVPRRGWKGLPDSSVRNVWVVGK